MKENRSDLISKIAVEKAKLTFLQKAKKAVTNLSILEEFGLAKLIVEADARIKAVESKFNEKEAE